MRKWLLALVALYVVSITWIGYLGADPDVLEAFGGQSRLVLFGVLIVFYAVPTALTIWLVGLLTRFSYRLAIKEAFDAAALRDRVLLLLVLAFFARALTLAVQWFAGSNLGLIGFCVPLAATIAVSRAQPGLAGPKRFLAFLPVYLYLVADVLLLLATARV